MDIGAAQLTRSAAAAYRTDAGGRAEPFGEHDGGWIAVTTLVQHAAIAPLDDTRILLRDAVELAESILDIRLDRASDLKNRERAQSDSAILVALTASMERAGALRLAAALLESLRSADKSLTTLESGRILALTARLAWKVGDIERAETTYRSVGRMGKQHELPELTARAAIGFLSLAQLHEDYSAARRWAVKAARLARRHGFADIARLAYQGLMLVSAKARDFDAALVHGWTAYGFSAGDPTAGDDLLTNLGQLLLDSGHPEPAFAAFSSVLSRSQIVRIGLPALGGLAVSAGRLGHPDIVEWAAGEVLRHAAVVNQPYLIADALTESATALYSIGNVSRAEECSAVALELAARFGFEQLRVRVVALAASPSAERGEQIQLAPRARRVAREIEALNPRRLPERVAFAAVA